MDLSVLWFILIAVLWTGYLFLDGYVLGVGMLLPVLGKSETDRRIMYNTIGPLWDGNQVWLLTAGGATFAAFPEWYATLFSGFYLPLLLILLALIARGMAPEYRGKGGTAAWRARWDWAMILGSWIPGILWGVAFANIVKGVPLDANHEYVGGFFNLLNPFALLGGVVLAVLFLLHGAIFIAMKTDGDIRVRATKLAQTLSMVALAGGAIWAIWLQLAYSAPWTWAVVALAAAALAATVIFTRAGPEGRAFISNGVVVLLAVVLIFGSLFPDVMPSAPNPENSLTIANASSTPYTLTVMTWVAVILVPFVLAYQAWTFYVFRKRITADHIPAPIEEEVSA